MEQASSALFALGLMNWKCLNEEYMDKNTTLNKTITFFIPENLNIDAIIQENAFGFYGQGLKKERALFFCSELVKSRAYHRKEMLEKNIPYAPLCSEYLKEAVNDYKPYLNFLLKHNVFLTDDSWLEGEKCKGYCFGEPYAGQKIKRIEVEDYILKRNLRERAEKWKEEHDKQMRRFLFLDKWWEKRKLEIDQEGAFEWIEQYREQKLMELAQKKRVKKRAFKIKTIHDTAEDFKQMVMDINEGCRYPGFSGRGKRFYNPISGLKRELRGFLTFDGKSLSDADFKNFQPFLLVNLLKRSFWKPKGKVPPDELCLERLDKEMYKE
jgi:hypothetical protein